MVYLKNGLTYYDNDHVNMNLYFKIEYFFNTIDMIKHLINHIKYDIFNFETTDKFHTYRLNALHTAGIEKILNYKRKHIYISILRNGHGSCKKYYTIYINKHCFLINNTSYLKIN